MPIKKTVETAKGIQTTFFYPAGNVWYEEYRNRAGELRRAKAPAIVAWHPNNQVRLHKYYRHGNLHHKSDPTIVEHDRQDNLEHLEHHTRGSPVAPPPQ